MAGVIRSHRAEYVRELLIKACRQTLKLGAIELVLQYFLGMREVIGKERLSGMYGVLRFKVSNPSVSRRDKFLKNYTIVIIVLKLILFY